MDRLNKHSSKETEVELRQCDSKPEKGLALPLQIMEKNENTVSLKYVNLEYHDKIQSVSDPKGSY